MTARRHYIHTQDGFRLRGSDVFVEVREVGGATSVKTGDEILLSELSARDVISFYVVIDGVEISLPIDLDSCSGNKGMRDPDVSFLDRVADVHGGAVAEKLALMLIDALPGVVKEENVGESEEWAKTALLSCAR